MPTSSLRILISGAGIGGPVAAYWLAKAGHLVTVVERAPVLRKEGQTIDIRREGLRIIEWMGIREKVNERTTKEAGMRLVDAQGKVWAAFPQEGDTGFTSEVEIVRGELAMLFYEVSRDNVKYIFGTTIEDFLETDDGVMVTLKSQSQISTGSEQKKMMGFDVLIVAEGLYSHTRAKAFSEPISRPIHSLNLFSAAFSLPVSSGDTLWAEGALYHKSRMTLSRPDGFGRTRVSVSWRVHEQEGGLEDARAIAHPKTPSEVQKKYVLERFDDLRHQSPTLTRFLEDGLALSDDLYLAEIGQVKTPSWSRGRVALLADTAYAPSAMTGMGTTTAIIGAYILASELVLNHKRNADGNSTDPTHAFRAYESYLRPWIEKIQRLPPGINTFGSPQSQLGVGIFYWVLYIFSFVQMLGVADLMSRLIPSTHQALKLPPPSVFEIVEQEDA